MTRKLLKTSGNGSGPKVPADFRKALDAVPKAREQWGGLTAIARRDFINWIGSAKQEKTRVRRITVACSKLAAGQRRPCCYAVVPLDLYKALAAAPKAKTQWSGLTPDERRDLVGWIGISGKPGTRVGRIAEACAMLAARKRRFKPAK